MTTTLLHSHPTMLEIVAPFWVMRLTPSDRRSRPPLVHDLMEPLRSLVDPKLIEMIRFRSFASGDIPLHPSGVVRLKPKLVRYVASEIQVEWEDIETIAGSLLETLKHS